MTASTSETVTLVLGIFGIVPLVSAISTLNDDLGGFADVASILMIFIHLLAILIALPFLLRATGQDEVDPIFKYGAQVIALVNAILMITVIFSLPNPNEIAYAVFGIITLLELSPILVMRTRYQGV